MKKGRHRRYEEARALKQNQDLDLDSILDSLDVAERTADEDSPAFDAWAAEDEDGDEDGDEDHTEVLEETAETA